MRTRARRGLAVVAAGALLALLAGASPATAAGEGERPPSIPPPTNTAPVATTVTPPTAPSAPPRTCRLYGSSSGYGLFCSGPASGGPTLADLFSGVIDTSGEFCWDDSDLPPEFDVTLVAIGPGERWYLNTCLSFNGPVTRPNARITYEFVHKQPQDALTLTPAQQGLITLLLDRGQIPILVPQASPVASPRVGQAVAFSMLCSAEVICNGSDVRTPKLDLGNVTMWAELVHLRVRPLGVGEGVEVNCSGAGTAQTAQQLDATRGNVPDDVCRYTYERSSKGQGPVGHRDRYPAEFTAYWSIRYQSGSDAVQTLGTYPKTNSYAVRVTEVQTLNVQ